MEAERLKSTRYRLGYRNASNMMEKLTKNE